MEFSFSRLILQGACRQKHITIIYQTSITIIFPKAHRKLSGLSWVFFRVKLSPSLIRLPFRSFPRSRRKNQPGFHGHLSVHSAGSAIYNHCNIGFSIRSFSLNQREIPAGIHGYLSVHGAARGRLKLSLCGNFIKPPLKLFSEATVNVSRVLNFSCMFIFPLRPFPDATEIQAGFHGYLFVLSAGGV